MLYDRLSRLGAETLVRVLNDITAGLARPQPQSHEHATPAPKLKKHEGRITWSLPAVHIYNKIRAYKPFPGTFSTIDGSVLGIEWAVPVACDSPVAPGVVVAVSSDGFSVRCGQDAIRILNVKPEGKRAMSVAEYLRGHPIEEGQTFA